MVQQGKNSDTFPTAAYHQTCQSSAETFPTPVWAPPWLLWAPARYTRAGGPGATLHKALHLSERVGHWMNSTQKIHRSFSKMDFQNIQHHYLDDCRLLVAVHIFLLTSSLCCFSCISLLFPLLTHTHSSKFTRLFHPAAKFLPESSVAWLVFKAELEKPIFLR